MDLHLKYLSTICRTCGTVKENDTDFLPKLSCDLRKYCSIYKDIDFAEESDKIYPMHICNICNEKFKIKYYNHLSGEEIVTLVHILNFEPHSNDNCSVCSMRFGLENTDRTYFYYNHMKNLSYCCRRCKTQSVKLKSQETHKCSVVFHKFFDSAVIVTLYYENIYVYPQYFCDSCITVIKASKYHISDLQHSFAVFEKHDKICSICYHNTADKTQVKNFHGIEHMKPTRSHITANNYEERKQQKIKKLESEIEEFGSESKALVDSACQTIPSLTLHKTKLVDFCRLCAKPNFRTVSKKSTMLPKNDSHITEYFKGLFRIDVHTEDKYIYPPSICLSCFSKMKANYKAKIKKRKAPFSKLQLPNIFDNNRHQCKICDYNCSEEKYCSSAVTDSVGNIQVSTRLDGDGDESTTERTEPDSSVLDTSRKKLKPNSLLLSEGIFYGLPVSQLFKENKNEGTIYSCTACDIISIKPVLASCHHLYCDKCLKLLTETNSVCYDNKCEALLGPEQIWRATGEYYEKKIANLVFVCSKSLISNKCDFKGSLVDTINHEQLCIDRSKVADKESGEVTNISTDDIFSKRSKDLVPLRFKIKTFCDEQNLDFKETLTYLLWKQFKDDGQIGAAETVKVIANSNLHQWNFFSGEESLAIKAVFLKSVENYNKEYTYYQNTYGMDILKDSEQIQQLENKFFPNFVCYRILDFCGNILLHKKSSEDFLISIIDRDCNRADLPIEGVSWNYTDALASTINELSCQFNFDVHKADNQIIFVEIKDGVKSFHETLSEQEVDVNVLRASFCILTVYSFIEGIKKILYKCDYPHLYRNNRDYFISICSNYEALKNSMETYKHITEKERFSLKYRLLDIRLSDGKFAKFYVKTFFTIYSNEFDEVVNIDQLHNTENFCTLCNTTKIKWTEDIHKNWQPLCKPDEEISTENFSADGISSSKKIVTLSSEHHKSLQHVTSLYISIDALRCDIIFATLIKDVIVHETAKVFLNVTECSLEQKHMLAVAQEEVMNHYQKYFGINLVGSEILYNNAVRFLNISNMDEAFALVTDTERKQMILKLIYWLSKLRSTYKAVYPSVEDIQNFKFIAVQFAKFLLCNFKYVSENCLGNLHKICEHGHEILELQPHSIGILSSEGLENGQILFNKLWKRNHDTGMIINILCEVLKESWLHTSPQLYAIAANVKYHFCCTLCRLEGHNVVTCPMKK